MSKSQVHSSKGLSMNSVDASDNEETMNKRQRADDSEKTGSQPKIRKMTCSGEKKIDIMVDLLTYDSPRESINLIESEENMENNDNAAIHIPIESINERCEAKTKDNKPGSRKIGSQSKIRRTTGHVEKKLDIMVDILTSDSPRESINLIETEENIENNVNAAINIPIECINKQRKAVTNGNEPGSGKNKPTTAEIEQHFDPNDSALVNALFSEFSDNEEAESARDNGISLTQPDKSSSHLTNRESVIDEEIIQLEAADSGLPECNSHFTEGLDELFDDWNETNYNLDLSNFKRCKIMDIDRGKRTVCITVEDPETMERAVVLCTGFWIDMKISLGEYVIIKAEANSGEWIVNNDVGFFVTQANELVAGTSVVGGLYCARKGILSHRYRGIDCLPNILPTDGAMTCGSIIHDLLQFCLKQQIYTLVGIKKQLEAILKRPGTIQMLYASGLTLKVFREMIDEYMPKIHDFMNRYVLGTRPPQNNELNVQIGCIKDIEESIWLPSLGIKGKIDVTVEVEIENQQKILPLEIKTGRASFSPEHKGQLYLYCMMLATLGHDVDSGLLLYIKDNIMQQIKSTRNEQRDLILLRNTMAYYLTKEPVPDEKNDEDSQKSDNLVLAKKNNDEPLNKPIKWKLAELPEPIYNANACSRCAFNTICCVYGSKDESLNLPDSHPHVKLTNKLLKDLTPAHIDYVINWISMLHMEESYNNSMAANRAIWIDKPRQRERQRTCLSFLKIDLPVVRVEEAYLHKFSRATQSAVSFPVDNFQEVFEATNYIMVNLDKRINIVSGFAIEVTKDSITLQLPKDLSLRDSAEHYHLDEFPSGSLPFKVLGTVAAMLADNDITRRLRKIMIDRQPATFERPLPVAMTDPTGRKILQPLNSYQREALMAVIKSDDYVLIKGMPGTGKTQTIVALIEMLTHLGHSVLITAHTHMAVDNILLKLEAKDIDFLRLGSRLRINEALNHRTDFKLIQQCDTPEQLEALYLKKNIVAVTCLGAHHILLSKRIFDYCVVDECTQALQPILLRPLFNARKFVLVGDPEQLPAVVKCSDARKLGMDEDMFSRLDSKNNTRILKLQYRMNNTIMDLANRLTYRGELMVGNEKIANATLRWTDPEALTFSDRWVRRVLSNDLKDAVIMLNTKATYGMNGNIAVNRKNQEGDDESSRCSNLMEATIILKLLKVALAAGIKPQDIGVIAPFKAQIVLLRRILPENVEINTVDQYQGRDKSVIFLSCTRSVSTDYKNRITEYEILEDHKRLNVAMTRAKHKLIIIGDKTSLMRFTPFGKLFDIMKGRIIDLVTGCDDFSWKNIRETMTGPRFEGLNLRPFIED